MWFPSFPYPQPLEFDFHVISISLFWRKHIQNIQTNPFQIVEAKGLGRPTWCHLQIARSESTWVSFPSCCFKIMISWPRFFLQFSGSKFICLEEIYARWGCLLLSGAGKNPKNAPNLMLVDVGGRLQQVEFEVGRKSCNHAPCLPPGFAFFLVSLPGQQPRKKLNQSVLKANQTIRQF